MGDLLSVYSDAERPGDCGSRVFMADEDDREVDKGSGDRTSVKIETSLVKLSGGLPHLGTIPQLPKYQDFWRISIQIKGILM